MLKEFDGNLAGRHRRAGAVWRNARASVAGRVLTEEEWRDLLGARPYAPACRE